jgi:uncharacterized protein HemX
MRSRTAAELAIMCATGLIALALVFYGLHVAQATGKSVMLVVVGLAIGSGMIALSRSLIVRNRTQAELTSQDRYRALAEEYRRLADLAITAQEHADLKLGEVSAQLDHLTAQNESMQKILNEVE